MPGQEQKHKIYLQPTLDTLRDKIDGLQKRFASLYPLYKAPIWEVLHERVLGLKKKYETLANPPDAQRLKQVTWIEVLCTKLQSACNKNPSESEKAQVIALGAVLFRYLRIDHAYDDEKPLNQPLKLFSGLVNYASLGWFSAKKSASSSASPKPLCRLHGVLEDALEISTDNPLDSWTIFVTLSAFKKHTQDNIEHYKPYIPYVSVEEFYRRIDELILKHDALSKPIQKELQYIDFLQSMKKAVLDLNQSAHNLINQAKENAKSPHDVQKTLEGLKPSSTPQPLPLWHALVEEQLQLSLKTSATMDVEGCCQTLQERMNYLCSWLLIASHLVMIEHRTHAKFEEDFWIKWRVELLSNIQSADFVEPPLEQQSNALGLLERFLGSGVVVDASFLSEHSNNNNNNHLISQTLIDAVRRTNNTVKMRMQGAKEEKPQDTPQTVRLG